MYEQKVIFICNHIINQLIRTAINVNIVRSASGDSDLIIDKGSVISILYLYRHDPKSKVTITYKSGRDFKLENNRVIWMSQTRPLSGQLYTCEIMLNYRYIRDYSESPKQCERCLGSGWYVGDMSHDGKSFGVSKNSDKLVQDFIKVLYTYSNTEDYGTRILEYVGDSVYDKDIYISDVSAELNSAAYQVQQRQRDQINDGSSISDEEMLSEMQILSAEYDKEEMSLYVSILLISVANQSVTIKLKI